MNDPCPAEDYILSSERGLFFAENEAEWRFEGEEL